MPLRESYAMYHGASYPQPENVLEGAPDYGDTYWTLVPSLVIDEPAITPLPRDVRAGVATGAFVGTLAVASPTRVIAGVATDATVGTFVYPTEPQTEFNVQYGAGGTEFTGQMPAGINIAVEDVRFGVNYVDGYGASQVGVLQLATTTQTLIGVGYGAYGTEYEGTLTDLPGGGIEPQPPVMTNGQLRSPLVIGDSYSSPTNAFVWDMPAPAGYSAGTASATFAGNQCCGNDTWSTEESSITEADGVWTLVFELTSAETSLIVAGLHDWSIRVSDDGEAFTAEERRGGVRVPLVKPPPN